MRKLAAISIVLCSISFLPGGNAAWAEETSGPVQLDQRVQLFIDDFLIERTEGVWRTLNRSRKVPENPIIKPDRPWEGYLVLQPGSVIYDPNERQFQMWYNTLATESDSDIEQFLCYATSKDGIRWEKPELGLVDFRGSKANNIVLRWCNWDHSVIRDPEDPDPKRLYKMVYWQTQDKDRCGIWSAFSADGIRWDDYDQNPTVPCWASGDTFSVMKDPVSRQYWLYHKTSPGGPRKLSRLVSDDFIHWRDNDFVLEPDEHDPPGTEFYGLSAFPYGSQYLGLLWVFHTSLQTMDVQIVSSRDGIAWDRSVHRRPFVSLGYQINQYSGHSFDSGMAWPATAPVIQDGSLWFYYSGFDNLHNAPSEEHTGQLGLARIRQDAFCSFDATAEGYVLTRLIKFSGKDLHVNVQLLSGGKPGPDAPWRGIFNDQPDQGGYLRVEVQDGQGDAIPGYEAEKSKLDPVDDIYRKVSWGERGDFEGLEDRPVRLKFVLSRAKLHSFRIN